MKTIIKLIIAAALLNAATRAGLSAWQQYQFRDAVQEIILFGSSQSTRQLTDQVLAAAAERGIEIDPEDVDVQRASSLTTAEATYVDAIELFPRYVYPMTWSFKVDARSAGQIRP